jgi:hypothetical protein
MRFAAIYSTIRKDMNGESASSHCSSSLAGRYEELRKIIDGCSESMTHEDALAELRRMQAAEEVLMEACKDTITYLTTHADDDSNVLWGKVSQAYRKALGVE